jgi:hypothetical protein
MNWGGLAMAAGLKEMQIVLMSGLWPADRPFAGL